MFVNMVTVLVMKVPVMHVINVAVVFHSFVTVTFIVPAFVIFVN